MAQKRKSDSQNGAGGRKRSSGGEPPNGLPASGARDGMLDYYKYPHILEAVIAFAPQDSLVQLRLVSKHLKKLAEAELCRHVVIYPDYGLVMRTGRGLDVNVAVGTLGDGGRLHENPMFREWNNNYIDPYRPMRVLPGNMPFAFDDDDDDMDMDSDEEGSDEDEEDEDGDAEEIAEPDFDSDDGDPDGYDIDEENAPDLAAILFPDQHGGLPMGAAGGELSDDSEMGSDDWDSDEGPVDLEHAQQMLAQMMAHAQHGMGATLNGGGNPNGDVDSDISEGEDGDGWETVGSTDPGDVSDQDDVGFGGVESEYANTEDEYSSEEELGLKEFSHKLPLAAIDALKNAKIVDIFQRPAYRGIIRVMRATDSVQTVRYHLPYAQSHSFTKCMYASNAPHVVQFSRFAPIEQYNLFDEGNPGSALGRSTRYVDYAKVRRGCKKAVFSVAYDVGCKGLRNGRIRLGDFPDTIEEVVVILTKTSFDMKPGAKGNRRDSRPYDGKGWFEEFVFSEASRPTHKLTIVGLQDIPPGCLSLKRTATTAEKLQRFEDRLYEAKRMLKEDQVSMDIYWELEGPAPDWDEQFTKYMDKLELLTHDEYKARLGQAQWSIENEIIPGISYA